MLEFKLWLVHLVARLTAGFSFQGSGNELEKGRYGMSKKMYFLMALAAGLAVNAQDAPPAAGGGVIAGSAAGGGTEAVAEAGVVQAGGLEDMIKPTDIKLAAPAAGAPKTVCAKALVGKGKLADHEFTVVLDGAKADGDLEILRVISADGKTAEIKLRTMGPDVCMAEAMLFLPGTDKACEGVICQLKAPDCKVSFMQMTKAMKANCDFAGKPHEVIVSDMNRNGKLGDPWTFPRDKDGFIAAGGGEDMKMGDFASIGGSQVMLGMPFVQDDALWDMTVADGKIVVKKQDVPMGSIAWKGENEPEALILLGKQMVLQLQKPEKTGWTLPVGDYRMMILAYKQDKFQVLVQREKGLPLTVVAGKPLELGPVTEAVAKVTAAPLDPQRNLRLSLASTTPDGGQVSAVLTLDEGKAPKAPGFRILDAAGKEVYKGNFEFG